ncbi:MAG TPA: hypothetical protein DEP03_06600 [Massilia sp.]|nr:hypothetical protein [Massilia sp.]
MTSFDQVRAMYGSDEQMARALFEQLAIVRLDLQLQRALRRRAEEQLQSQKQIFRKPKGEKKA